MTDTKPTPIEAWLRQRNLTVECMLVHEDETTRDVDVESLSMRGAQREITGWLIGEGYSPVGRWQTEHQEVESGEGYATETSRKFKLV